MCVCVGVGGGCVFVRESVSVCGVCVFVFVCVRESVSE